MLSLGLFIPAACPGQSEGLYTYMRASMGQDRLSSLCLLHIHYDRTIDLEAVNIYSQMHPRQMELEFLIKPTDADN